MEDINNTSNQKQFNLKLKIFIDESCVLDGVQHPLDLYSLTEDISLANIVIEHTDSPRDYIATYSLNGKISRVRFSTKNFHSCLEMIFKILINQDLCIRTERNTSKPILKYIKSFSKNETTVSIFDFALKETNLNSFTQSLLKLKIFETYKTIHLFTHEKGSSQTQEISIEREAINCYKRPVQVFTTLFNAIKKSKNRSFGQSTLRASSFQVIGTCLAHEYTLDTHNIIFIITKNDFIAQSKQEIQNFESNTNIFGFFFNQFLIFQSYQKKIHQFQEFTNHIKVKIDDNSNLLVFDKNLKSSFKKLISQHDVQSNLHSEKLNLLGELLNTLRHELSNPLFGLQLSTELLKAEKLDEDQRDMVNSILLSIERSQSIIKNFSDLYKSNSKMEAIDIKKLIQEVFTITKSESRSITNSIQIESSSERETVFLIGNKTWLAQIFFNLIINSAQAMRYASTPKPEINILIKETKTKEVVIYFSDNGPGVKHPSDQIFDPFFTTKKDGTGLGLNICKNLIEKMGGQISLLKNGKGASFKLILQNENTDRRG